MPLDAWGRRCSGAGALEGGGKLQEEMLAGHGAD